MNAKTKRALAQSIEHWKRLASGKRQKGEDIGSTHCALCDLFLDVYGCDGCPVAKRIGASQCDRTPYNAATEARYNFGLDSPEFKRAAKVELKFLKSLR